MQRSWIPLHINFWNFKDGLSLAVPVDLLTRIWDLELEPRFSYEEGTTLVGYTAYPALD